MWLRYSEILPGINAITGEDFVTDSLYRKCLESTISGAGLDVLDVEEMIRGKGRMARLGSWFDRKLGNDSLKKKKLTKFLKDKIIENVSGDEINEDYFEMLNKLKERIEN